MNTPKHPTFKFQLSVELMEWLKDCSKQTGQLMVKIIKEPLESLRCKDTKAQHRLKQAKEENS